MLAGPTRPRPTLGRPPGKCPMKPSSRCGGSAGRALAREGRFGNLVGSLRAHMSVPMMHKSTCSGSQGVRRGGTGEKRAKWARRSAQDGCWLYGAGWWAMLVVSAQG